MWGNKKEEVFKRGPLHEQKHRRLEEREAELETGTGDEEKGPVGVARAMTVRLITTCTRGTRLTPKSDSTDSAGEAHRGRSQCRKDLGGTLDAHFPRPFPSEALAGADVLRWASPLLFLGLTLSPGVHRGPYTYSLITQACLWMSPSGRSSPPTLHTLAQHHLC